MQSAVRQGIDIAQIGLGLGTEFVDIEMRVACFEGIEGPEYGIDAIGEKGETLVFFQFQAETAVAEPRMHGEHV